MRRVLAMTAAAATLALAGHALAAPGLANRVYSPYVMNGVTEVELRTGRIVGGPEDGDSAAVLELEQGLNDRVSLGLVAEFEDEPGDPRKLDSIGVESVIYLGQIPRTGVDVGLYLEYEQRIHNESGVGEAKLLLARQTGPVQTTMNLIARQPFTDRPGEGAMSFGYAAQATVEPMSNLRLGVQAFGDLGDSRSLGGSQQHYLGPMLNWEGRPGGLPFELGLEAAYLFPLGAARSESNGQFRLMIEVERRF